MALKYTIALPAYIAKNNVEIMGTHVIRTFNTLNSWSIYERGTEWRLISLSVDDWEVYGVKHFEGDVAFRCQFTFSNWSSGQEYSQLSINSVDTNGKHYVHNKYLKKFKEVVLLMCGLIKNGYVKI